MKTKILKIYPDNPQPKLIQEVVEVLNKGGLIIYPSDTVYAAGAKISDNKAMERLARFKNISPDKAHFSIVCDSLSHLSQLTKPLDTSVFRLLKQHLPGPFTFILPAGKQLPNFYKNNKTIGIRVPDHGVTSALITACGEPLASTSIYDEDEIVEYCTDPELIAERFDGQVDLVIDSGILGHTASTVVDVTDSEPIILRQGKGIL